MVGGYTGLTIPTGSYLQAAQPHILLVLLLSPEGQKTHPLPLPRQMSGWQCGRLALHTHSSASSCVFIPAFPTSTSQLPICEKWGQ